jgi:hypothetical protein
MNLFLLFSIKHPIFASELKKERGRESPLVFSTGAVFVVFMAKRGKRKRKNGAGSSKTKNC